MLVASGVISWTVIGRQPGSAANTERLSVPAEPISLDGAPTLGQPDARVALVVFSDFECPFCGRFANEIVPAIRSRYIDDGRVKMAFRHLPLNGIHPKAFQAAEASECGARQGRFWEFHDQFFADQQKLKTADFLSYARALGVDETAFGGCLRGGASDRIQQDLALAERLHITGTPTLLLGRVRPDGLVNVVEAASGIRSVEKLSTSFDKLLGQS